MKTKPKPRLTPVPSPRRTRAPRSDRQAAAASGGGAEAPAAGPDLSHIAPQLRSLAVRTGDVEFLAENALDHDQEEIEDIRELLRRRGQLLPLVINRRPTPPVVLGGNKRLRGMLAENWQWVAVVDVDLADDDAAALALELNATQGQAWNRDLLRKALDSVGKLTLGERTESLFSRLAEAQKLIPRLGDKVHGPAPDEEVEEDSLDLLFKAPYPWFGGKSRIAKMVWKRFGDVRGFLEPFFGSGAVMLNRPQPFEGTETVNDFDDMICNFWRAVKADPEKVAEYADWPVVESDLHSRHAWLMEQKANIVPKLEGDLEFFDAKAAGFWAWGMSLWIGAGFCSGNGPWRIEVAPDGTRQLVHLGNAGQGVNRKRVHLSGAGQGVNRKRVHLSGAGQGVNRQLVHLGDAGQGAEPQARPGNGECGLLAWMQALAERLRRVRVCCGDWTRVCGGRSGDAIAHFFGGGEPCGVFLDPPYKLNLDDGKSNREACYNTDSAATDDLAAKVCEWAIAHGDDKRLRIALCGYEGEYKMPDSWTCVAWKAHGGMAGLAQAEGTQSKQNAYRERVWFSPHCLKGGAS